MGVPRWLPVRNGLCFSGKLRGFEVRFEKELRRIGVVAKTSRGYHPQTCGKVERFQQTMKKWLRTQPTQPGTIAELQALLDVFADQYNHHRPHRSLPHRATPAALYETMPKALTRSTGNT